MYYTFLYKINRYICIWNTCYNLNNNNIWEECTIYKLCTNNFLTKNRVLYTSLINNGK